MINKCPVLIAMMLLISASALAKGVEDRVKALEDRWAQYESVKIEQNAKLAESIAQMDKFRSDIQALGGGSETQNVQMKQLQDNVERHYRDLEMRIGALEEQLKLLREELSRAVTKISPQLAEETKNFQKGLTHIQNGEYAQAITAFQQFIKQYPKSPTRADAFFWIGECRYAMKDYTQAIKDYQKFVDQFPKSDKAPSVLLKQGDAFLNLQMKNEAKVFWKKLVQDFPKSDEAAQAKGKLEALDKPGTPPPPAVPSVIPAAPTAPVPPPTPKNSQEF